MNRNKLRKDGRRSRLNGQLDSDHCFVTVLNNFSTLQLYWKKRACFFSQNESKDNAGFCKKIYHKGQ